jgi:hypothetical protein
MKVGLALLPTWDVATVPGNLGGRNGRPVVEWPMLGVGPVIAPNPRIARADAFDRTT